MATSTVKIPAKRFTARVEKALKALAWLPWMTDCGIRIQFGSGDRTCPVCAFANTLGRRTKSGETYSLNAMSSMKGLWSAAEIRSVMDAADDSEDARRPRLLQLLGVAA